MELKRILARDTRSATEKAMALFGPDVLIISNNRVEGQTELIVALDVAEGRLAPDQVTEAAFAARLDTVDLPDPDLIIRTSGETRTSNFLPWQGAYAEYEFTDTLWPDFTAGELARIVARFGNRERRFGGVVAK